MISRQNIGDTSNETLYIVLLQPLLTEEFLASLPLEAFSNSNIWLVLDQEKKLPGTKIHFPIDSQVHTFRQQSLSRIVIEEVYQISQTSETIVLPYGSWDQDQDLIVSLEPLEERRQDLQGLVLRGQTLPEPPYTAVEMENDLVNHIGGIIGDIWHGVLEPSLNFTTALEQPKDRQFGVPRGNGKEGWTGIVGALMDGKADVGVSNFYITSGRSKVVAFGPGIMEGITRFYIKFPGQEINWLTFLLPFSDDLWLGLLALFFTLAVFLAASYRLGPEKKLNPKSFVPGSTLVVVWGSWIAQGSSIDPKSIASRIVFLVSFLCGVLIYTAYSAKLISFLSVTKATLPFSSMKELLHVKDFSVGTLRGTSMVSFFFDADENSLRWRMGQELIMPIEENLVGSITQGLARAKSHKYAFLSDMVSTPLFFPASQTGCEFLEVIPSQPIMITNIDSIYRTHFHLHISPGSL